MTTTPLLACATLTLLAPLLLVGEPRAAGGSEDEVDRILAKVSRDGLPSVWDHALELSDLGEEHTNTLRTRMREASALARLTMSRALLDLEEVPDARDGLLGVSEDDAAPMEVRIASIEMLGAPSFHGDREVATRLRDQLDRTFKPELQLALAKSLYFVSSTDKSDCASLLEEWLHSDRRDLRIKGALALAEIGKLDRSASVLRNIKDDPTPEGALADAYLKIRDLERALQHEWRRRTPAQEISDPQLRLFKEVFDLALDTHIQGKDYSTPEGREELTSAAANGLLSRLDPHSTFFTNDKHIEWNLDLLRDYGGIGAYVDILNNVFTITRPIYGGPAYDAGLRSGDQILEVDGWSTEGVTDMQEIIKRLKGPPETGTKVKVFRRGWREPREFELSRARIVIPSVSSDMLPGGIGYLEIITFGGETVQEVDRALRELQSQGMRALIVDVRYNSGGFLNSAVDLVGYLCGADKLVVTTRGRQFKDEEEYVTRSLPTPFADAAKLPMAILINRFSASASEILTGNIRHYERGAVVGEHTYGKGSVQSQVYLRSHPPELFRDTNGNRIYDAGEPFTDDNENGRWDPGPFVKITTARYYLPDGSCINREYDREGKLIEKGGITPDLRVELDDRLMGKSLDVNPLLERLDDEGRNVFQAYVEQRYAANPELFLELAIGDGFDTSRYPDFDAFYAGLETELSQDDVRFLLRTVLRKKISDEMVRDKPFPYPGSWILGDVQEDTQLQAAVQKVLSDLGEKPADHAEFAFFDGKELVLPPEEEEDEGESGGE